MHPIGSRTRLPIKVIGIGADGLPGMPPEAREAVDSADFLAGGRRHLALIGPHRAELFAITDNLDDLAARLRDRSSTERCVVLASGDPLFYGIGAFLGSALGRDQISVEPAVSSMQRAFAGIGSSWHDATVASVHGRPLAETLRPHLGCPKLGIFTRDGRSPSEIAAFFVDRGLDGHRAWVAEALGTDRERVREFPIGDLIGRAFDDLNIVILERIDRPKGPEAGPPGFADEAFAAPEEGPVLLTHSDVRAVSLARFRDLPGGPIWDVGAGLGGVSVELARAFPGRDVVAIERSPDRLPFLVENRKRFEAWNLRIVAGDAPDALLGEERPAAVFLGGSGGRLGPILDAVADRLVPGGLVVANFVGLENLAESLARFRSLGWKEDVTEVRISPARPLAGLTTFVPIRPVWVVRARRSAEDSA